MNPHELSQKCIDKSSGKVDTTAVLFAYKFFSAWRPIDYSELDTFLYDEKVKHEKQNRHTLKCNANTGFAHHVSLKSVALGIMSAKHMAGGRTLSRAASLLRNDPSKKDLKALVSAVRDSFYAGYGVLEEVENESDEEEIEILLDDCISRFDKTIKLCERTMRKYRGLTKVDQDKAAIQLFHGRSLAAKALSLEKLKDFNEALQLHMKAISVFKKLGDAQTIAEHLYNAAWCPLHLYLDGGRQEEYIEVSLKLLDEAIHLEPTEEQSTLIENIKLMRHRKLALVRNKKAFHGIEFSPTRMESTS